MTLIYEGGYGGHRIEYIEYMILYLDDYPEMRKKYLFVLNSKLKSQIKLSESILSRIEVIYLHIDIYSKSLLKQSFKEWKLISEIIKENPSIKKVLFMNLDMFQYVILLPGFLKYKVKVGGIIFQPYIHLPLFKKLNFYSIKTYLLKIRKQLTFRLLFRFNNYLHVFILNDKEGVNFLNKEYKLNGGKSFKYLPDPIDDRLLISEGNKGLIYSDLNIEYDKKVLLIFGKIDSKKNVERILNAIALLPIEIQRNITLIIAGNIVDDLNDRINAIVCETLEKHKSLQILIRNQFVTNQERENLFKVADIVLMPYIDFYSSSGVIGHAIKYNKKVIASSFGIIKRIIEDNSLGLTVDPYNINAIKEAIILLFSDKIIGTDFNYENYKEEHHFKVFSKTLLSFE